MKIVDACFIDGEPAPIFERLLNKALTKPKGKPTYKTVRHDTPAGQCYHTVERMVQR